MSAIDRIRALKERLAQRFNAAEAEELATLEAAEVAEAEFEAKVAADDAREQEFTDQEPQAP